MQKVNAAWWAWIDCDPSKVQDWSCTFSINEATWISPEYSTPVEFVSWVIQWTTWFIWTVITVTLIYSWLKLIFAWANESAANAWKQWIKYSIIGLWLVIFSYSIIKLVQFLAAG